MSQVFDTATRHYNPLQVMPKLNPELQLRLPVNLVASTVYPAGSLIGELTATPGKFGLTITISHVALASNVATVTTVGPHGLSVGDSVAVTAVTATTINGTGLTVLSVPTTTTFTYAKTASDVTGAADTGKVVRNAGTDSPKAVLPMALITDSNGVIYQGDSTGGEDGTDTASPFFTGIFKAGDLSNVDAVAVAAMTGAKTLSGSISDGSALIKIA